VRSDEIPERRDHVNRAKRFLAVASAVVFGAALGFGRAAGQTPAAQNTAASNDDCSQEKDHVIEIGDVVSCKSVTVSKAKGNTILWRATNPDKWILIVWDRANNDPPVFPAMKHCDGTMDTCQSGKIDDQTPYGSHKYYAYLVPKEGGPPVLIDPDVIVKP
jgi:hypothetical protein